MTTDGQFPKTRRLIDRDAEMDLMREVSQLVTDTGKSCVLYLEARGGLGKTRLLKEYRQIVGESSRQMLVSDIVDMYDFENRKPIEVERKLVNSLKKEARQQQMTDELIDKIFHDYEHKYGLYSAIRGFSHESTRRAETNLHEAFIENCNQLGKYFPIVLRFDTFEVVINSVSPEYAFIFERQRKTYNGLNNLFLPSNISTGANIVLRWFSEVLAKLRPALIIVAGRPVKQNRFIEDLQKMDYSIHVRIRELFAIKDLRKISEYLKEYNIFIDEDRLPYIQKITGGFPLLLTLYARTRPDDTDKPPRSTLEFEGNLIEQTFNPLGQLLPDQNSSQPPDPKYILTLCLFILSCARRGILRKDLRGVFDWLRIERDDRVIDALEDEMLIKTVQSWHQPSTMNADSKQLKDSNFNLQKDNTLLFLHDEIFILIDESKKLDDLRYRDLILDYLCKTSEQQACDREIGVPLLKLFSDHMYYELTRDITRGYRTYTIYIDWFLRQRYLQDALILAEVFWTTLFYEVRRDGEVRKPFYEKLAESMEVDEDDIRREENVRYVKLLRFRDENQEAIAWAETLYEQFVQEGILPPRQNWHSLVEMKQGNYYVFIDLCLTWATALTRTQIKPEGFEALYQHLFANLIQFLESEELRCLPESSPRLNRQLAYLRREFFLGETLNTIGQFYQQQQDYAAAVTNLMDSYRAFGRYDTEPIPIDARYHRETPSAYLNDNVTPDQGQALNNLAYSTVEIGTLERASRRSDMVIDEYIDTASTYQQALFYNTNALILMRRGDYSKAERSLRNAEQAANKSGVDRVQGLVKWARGLYDRAKMNSDNQALPSRELINSIDNAFEVAAIKLKDEHSNKREILHEQARFARDLAVLYQRLNIAEGYIASDEARRPDMYWKKALDYVNEALELLKDSDAFRMQRANLLETKACIHNTKGEYEDARDYLMHACELMHDEMPRYGQVVAGKIALQRGVILLHMKQPQEALREMAIALARAYLFAPQYRDQAAFERLLTRWVADGSITFRDLRAFVRALNTEPVWVSAGDLPAPSVKEDSWLTAWESSFTFFNHLKEIVPVSP